MIYNKRDFFQFFYRNQESKQKSYFSQEIGFFFKTRFHFHAAATSTAATSTAATSAAATSTAATSAAPAARFLFLGFFFEKNFFLLLQLLQRQRQVMEWNIYTWTIWKKNFFWRDWMRDKKHLKEVSDPVWIQFRKKRVLVTSEATTLGRMTNGLVVFSPTAGVNGQLKYRLGKGGLTWRKAQTLFSLNGSRTGQCSW